MSDKFLNDVGLETLREWILGKLGLKQDTLVSGTNIKTVNNTSLLGSGNIGAVSDVTINGTSITSGGVAEIDEQAILAALGYEETVLKMTAIDGTSVQKTILIKS